MPQQQQQNWLRLHLTTGLGRVGLIKLIAAFGSATQALNSNRQQWKDLAGLTSLRIGTPPAPTDPLFTRAWRQLESSNAKIISLWDDNYPTLLRTIHDPPALLYVRGKLPEAECKGVAIVGSRHATTEGITMAREMATTLAHYNLCVISGLARGIDTAAHNGALDGNGHTIAVLGGGIDKIYPAENRRLFDHIADRGTILSEYPPGTEPKAGHFPARNRIISGLSEGVVVVEATHNSGSLLTADFALEQGRDVFAVPGSVYNPNCQGTLKLLKQGAILTTTANDILENFHINQQAGHPQTVAKYDLSQLNSKQKKLFDLLQPTPLHLDQLAEQSGLTPMDVSAIVLHLELEGLASSLPGGRYIRGFAG